MRNLKRKIIFAFLFGISGSEITIGIIASPVTKSLEIVSNCDILLVATEIQDNLLQFYL